MTDSADRSERHVRQVRLPQVGEQGQARLAASRVVIVGVGATGSHLAETLGRAGVGHLRLVDRDVVELSNLQRQALFTDEDAAAVRPKAVAAAQMLRRIDPGLDVEAAVEDLTADNVERLLADADVVLDGTDNFPTRFLVNDVCVRNGQPFVYSGVVGVEGQTLVVRPGGPCLRCYVPELPAPGSLPTCDTAGVLGAAVTLVTSLAASAAVRLLLGAEEQSQLGRVSVVDAWSGTVHALELRREPDCPCCARGHYEFLDSAPRAEATVLCGRDAVQLPAESGAVHLDHLAAAWKDEGEVRIGPFMVRLDTPERRVLVFQDGRMIVGNTDDPAVARSIRARLLGT